MFYIYAFLPRLVPTKGSDWARWSDRISTVREREEERTDEGACPMRGKRLNIVSWDKLNKSKPSLLPYSQSTLTRLTTMSSSVGKLNFVHSKFNCFL